MVKDINFRDSLLLLPASLDKLSKTFLGKDKNKIDYIFIIKSKNDIIKYCCKDSRLLYETLKKFNLDFTYSLTLSSLALKIYRIHYIPKDTIENSTNTTNIANFIRHSYKGGLCTIITPISDKQNISLIDRH